MFSFFKKKPQIEEEKKISQEEDFRDIEDLIMYFKNETGIDFFNKKEIIKNKLIIFCRKREIFSFRLLFSKILEDRYLKQELIDYLTVNETYFFRETPQIEKMIRVAKELGYKAEILCAPSSSGEEPYTIAMMLLEAGFKGSDFHIIGIDISEKIISKAFEARYNERSLHRVSDTLKEKYFTKIDEFYALKDIIKDRVSFRCVNIFDENLSALRKFDFIFSRNMMIYFDQETKIKAKNILQKLLKRPEDSIYFGHADMVS
ncbi:MAG: protein-glutamate O-methyltransferase CheR [Epsilonproteobacteria bacterium]|nr:protein-glutamate O-methyltransferase CheR [Campylobacterota bacterium]